MLECAHSISLQTLAITQTATVGACCVWGWRRERLWCLMQQRRLPSFSVWIVPASLSASAPLVDMAFEIRRRYC